jgi:nitrate/TMAO reductase-like tetraheme cytochrome c subunit
MNQDKHDASAKGFAQDPPEETAAPVTPSDNTSGTAPDAAHGSLSEAAPPANPGASTGVSIPKKKGKRALIVVGIVAAVLVLAGIGGVVWHESPSFCNALCHNPMDPYVEGFYSGDSMLLVTAHAEAGDECLDCHKASVGEQLTELGAYISGDFKTPLPMTKNGTRELCLSCHDAQDIKASTANYGGSSRNPHDSHYKDSLECYTCHRVHRESVMYCAECHPDISGPAGWEK